MDDCDFHTVKTWTSLSFLEFPDSQILDKMCVSKKSTNSFFLMDNIHQIADAVQKGL